MKSIFLKTCLQITWTLVVLFLFNVSFHPIAWATYQLPDKARTRLDELGTLKFSAETRAVQIMGGLEVLKNADPKIFAELLDCKNKYEIARQAYSLIIDRIGFLSKQGQDFSTKDLLYTEKLARERRKEFWDCQLSHRHDTANNFIIRIDGESLKDVVEIIFIELKMIKEDRERRNVLSTFAEELEKQKWASWEEIEKRLGMAFNWRGRDETI